MPGKRVISQTSEAVADQHIPDDVVAPAHDPRALVAAVVLSIAFHLFIFFFAEPDAGADPVHLPPLQVSLVKSPEPNPAEDPSEPVEARADAAAAPEPIADLPVLPASTDTQPTPEMVQPEEIVAESAAMPDTDKTVLPTRRPTVITMIERHFAEQRGQIPAEPIWRCDEAQRATRIRKCDERESDAFKKAVREPVTFALRQPRTKFGHFGAAMKRVDTLMKRQELLDGLEKTGVYDKQELAVMRREIREEIDRLDTPYSRFDILELLGIPTSISLPIGGLPR